MNRSHNLLYLYGDLLDSPFAADVEPSYAQGYGNRVANQRAFPKLGHAHARSGLPAPARSVVACTAGACG